MEGCLYVVYVSFVCRWKCFGHLSRCLDYFHNSGGFCHKIPELYDFNKIGSDGSDLILLKYSL